MIEAIHEIVELESRRSTLREAAFSSGISKAYFAAPRPIFRSSAYRRTDLASI
jgi:hypothetical protein